MGNLVQKLNRLLPLVAIGTIADCQSILEPTNRKMTKIGIQILKENTHRIPGLELLLKQTGILDKIMFADYPINSQDIAFTLSPILNAAGRITHAKLAINAILCDYDTIKSPFAFSENDEFNSLHEVVDELIEINSKRKLLVKEVVSTAQQVAQKQVESGEKMIWVEGPWNKGIIGLIASKLVNQFNLPTVVLSVPDSENFITENEIAQMEKLVSGGEV